MAAAFLAALWLPPARTLFSSRRTISEVEKRRLAEPPALPSNLQDLRSFPAAFEAYFNDHFGFRDPLIRWHNTIKYRWLGTSPTPRVRIGRRGWLYTVDHGAVDDFIGAAGLDPYQLAAWQRILTARRDWLAARGVTYLFAVAPNKQTVYPEHLPRFLHRAAGRTRLDQFRAYFAARGDQHLLDLRPALLEAKRRDRVYLKTDTHWNRQGAYIAYQAVMRRLAAQAPDLRILGEDDLRRGEFLGGIGDLANMLNLGRDTPRERVPYIRFRHACARHWNLGTPGWTRPAGLRIRANTCAAGRRTAVVFHDSFGEWMIPFLAESFSRVVFVNRAYRHDLMARLLRRVRPDVVIEERVERLLGQVPRPLLDDETINDPLQPRLEAAGRPLLRMSPQAGWSGLRAAGQVSLRADARGLILRARGPDPNLRLDFDSGDGPGAVMVRLDLHSPVETILQVFYAAGSQGFVEARSRERILRVGRNAGILRLPTSGGALRLRLDPGKAPGVYRLAALSVYREPASAAAPEGARPGATPRRR